MSSNIECFVDDASEEEIDITKENEKESEKLFTNLGFIKPPNKERKSIHKKSQYLDEDITSVFQSHYKTLQQEKEKKLPFKPGSQKKGHPFYRIAELQKELETVAKEINEYIQIYGENPLLKETEKYEEVLKELGIYSDKLNELMNNELYLSSINKKYLPHNSGNKNINTTINEIKLNIKANLENYTISTVRLMDIISNEKVNYLNEKENSNNTIETITHDIMIDKNLFDEKLKIDEEIKEIEKRLQNLEKIIGVNENNKKLIDESDESFNKSTIISTLNGLIIFVDELIKTKKINKEKSLAFVNKLLDMCLSEKNRGKEISRFFIQIKELYAILELYETYGDIFIYIKRRLKAIKTIHESSTSFVATVDDLKDLMNDNEKKYEALNKKYNETFNELNGLENILKELKVVEQYLSSYLVD